MGGGIEEGLLGVDSRERREMSKRSFSAHLMMVVEA